MSIYRIFQINGADHIVDGHVVTCQSDDEVAAVAPKFLVGHAAVEVWIDRRRVTRLSGSSPDGIGTKLPRADSAAEAPISAA